MRKHLIRILIFVILFFSAFAASVHAADTKIWQIGKLTSFSFADQNREVIDYNIPSDWPSLINMSDPNWGDFPANLYPESMEGDVTKEVRINYNYTENYTNPKLEINTTMPQGVNYVLKVFKGDGASEVDWIPLSKSLIFGIGYIKKGWHQSNSLILRISSDSNQKDPITFIMLSLSFNTKDSDGDGVSDEDEGNDFRYNESVVSIPMRSHLPGNIRNILLDIMDQDPNNLMSFIETEISYDDSIEIPDWLESNYNFPYGFLNFKVNNVKYEGEARLRIRYFDEQDDGEIYPTAKCFTFSDIIGWYEIDYLILEDKKGIEIVLEDGGAGDSDGIKDTTINTGLTLGYPNSLNIGIDKADCFLDAISGGRD